MGKTISALVWAVALAACLLGVLLLSLTALRGPDSSAAGPETTEHRDPEIVSDLESAGVPAGAVGRLPAPEESRETEIAARIEEARHAYLGIVHARGLPSRVKARRRLEEFESAVASLAALGPEGIPHLLERLRGETSQHARLLLLTAISRIHGDAGADGVLEALGVMDDGTIEHLFLDRLTRSRDPRDRRVVEEILRQGDSESRGAIIASATARRNESFWPYLPQIALGDPDPLVRAQALAAAQRLEVAIDPSTLERIVRSDPDPLVQTRALELFAEASPGGLVGVAGALFNGGAGPETQAALIDLLSRSPEPGAGELLEEVALNSPSEEVRRHAATAARLRETRRRRAGDG